MHVNLPGNIRLEYERFGRESAPVILLIMGLGAHMQRWNVEICDGLVARGFCVIRFDNRDAGLSSRLDAAGVPPLGEVMSAALQGKVPAIPYTLCDMAADTLGLMDALGIAAAHVVGISMGGAIAQIHAAQHPSRVRSLNLLMTSSGSPTLPGPTPAAAASLFAPLPRDRSRESIVADGMRRYFAVASPAYPSAPAWVQAMLEAEYDRGFHPSGVARQLAAIIAGGDRRPLLAQIRVPTRVLHGAEDPLIPPACGEDIARHVPGAVLELIEGMGHDLPLALTGRLVDAIAGHAERVERVERIEHAS